jgi:ribosomal protein L7/L12
MGRSDPTGFEGTGADTAALEVKESKTGEALEGRAPESAKSEKRSWMTIVRSGAQLTLDVIRVVREATDLYRHLRYRD